MGHCVSSRSISFCLRCDVKEARIRYLQEISAFVRAQREARERLSRAHVSLIAQARLHQRGGRGKQHPRNLKHTLPLTLWAEQRHRSSHTSRPGAPLRWRGRRRSGPEAPGGCVLRLSGRESGCGCPPMSGPRAPTVGHATCEEKRKVLAEAITEEQTRRVRTCRPPWPRGRKRKKLEQPHEQSFHQSETD